MIFDTFTLSLITAILGFGIWNIQRFMEGRSRKCPCKGIETR